MASVAATAPRIVDVIVEYSVGEKAGPIPTGKTNTSLVIYPTPDPASGATMTINGTTMQPGDFSVLASRERTVGPIKRDKVDSDGFFFKGGAGTSGLQSIVDAVTGSQELKPYMEQRSLRPREGARNTVTFSYWKDGGEQRQRMQRTFPIDAVPGDLRAAFDTARETVDLFQKVQPDGTLTSMGDRHAQG